MVVPYGPNSIQELVKTYSPNGEVDVLSIDVDGLDYDLLSTVSIFYNFLSLCYLSLVCCCISSDTSVLNFGDCSWKILEVCDLLSLLPSAMDS